MNKKTPTVDHCTVTVHENVICTLTVHENT